MRLAAQAAAVEEARMAAAGLQATAEWFCQKWGAPLSLQDVSD